VAVGGKLGAFLAEDAGIGTLDLDFLALFIKSEHFARAGLYEGTHLSLVKLGIHQLFVDRDERLLPHDASGDRRPLCVNLSDALLGN